MIITIWQRAWSVLMKKPLKLWAISLLAGVLTSVLTALCGVAIPALGLAISLLLSTSMTMVYLHGYRGEEVNTLQLFDCFKDWKTIKRVVLGLAWMNLWIFLWSLIPVVGIFFAIVRAYEYRLTPYILITEPDVPLTEAIKVSSQRTNGYKLQMFLADFLLILMVFFAVLVVGVIFGFLATIPLIGVLLMLAFVLAVLILYALLPLFMGLVQAAFYEEISHPTMPQQAYGAPQQTYGAPQQTYGAPQQTYGAPQQGAAFCTGCGAPLTDGAAFCPNCGKPRN